MKTRLTLSIDVKKIKSIKKYAKQKGTSVSNIVESYFDKLIPQPLPQKLDINKLRGVFGKVPKNFDWKKERTDYLLKKYGL